MLTLGFLTSEPFVLLVKNQCCTAEKNIGGWMGLEWGGGLLGTLPRHELKIQRAIPEFSQHLALLHTGLCGGLYREIRGEHEWLLEQ